MCGYVRWLATRVQLVLVVDGSDPALFARTADMLPVPVRHVAPSEPPTPNGKVSGVCTGIRLAAAAGVAACIVADDDVRYDEVSLAAMSGALRHADVVVPQNYFRPAAWHAIEDTARTLLNRVLRADYPGTLGVRCAALPTGYAGDVLFENLELIRTVRAFGGGVVSEPGIYVRRMPPTVRHFLGQRIRQAYDSQAQPVRLAAELALLPAAVHVSRRPGWLLSAALVAVGVAEAGRRRAGGRAYFPATASWCAPLWLAERAICSWLALGARLRGGVRYRHTRLHVAAHSRRELRRRAARGRPGLVGAVAERLD